MKCDGCGKCLTWERLAKLGQYACDCYVAPLTAEEEAVEQRRDQEQQARKDRATPETYDRWPGQAGWVSNDY